MPFEFIRERAPLYGLRNLSLERLRHVSFSLLGPGAMPVQVPVTLEAGATTWIEIRGRDLALATILVVRWRREDGQEYLWRASF